MAKQEAIKQLGTVVEALPNIMFRVKLKNEMLILCTISGKLKQNFIKIIEGDDVELEMSPYDLTRGRITKRLTKSRPVINQSYKKRK